MKSFFFKASLVTLIFLLFPSAEAQQLRVSGFVDFNAGTWSTGSILMEDTLCVYKSSGGTMYRVTASGTGSGGAFTIAQGAYSVPYGVKWKRIGQAYQDLSANVARSFTGAENKSEICNKGDTSGIAVSFLDTNLSAARAGNYAGTLVILIEP